MNVMKCEICGSNDIVKSEGYFVCQHCGTKYTVEDARKLIGTVTIDKTDENEKYLILARRAVQNSDVNNGLKYWELVAENDPMNWEAIFYLPYFRIINNPANRELVVPFANAIREAFDLIHESETLEQQLVDVKEIYGRVRGAGSDMQLGIINLLGDHVGKVISTGIYEGIPSVPYPHIFMNATAEKIKEYYSDNSELVSYAEDLQKSAKEYESYPLEQNAKASQYASEHRKREYEKARRDVRGCYIATCVYGSYNCPEVWTLRRYRDNTLSSFL